MVDLSNYFRSKEFLISLILLPIFIFINLKNAQYELTFAVISGFFILLLLGFLIYLSIKNRIEDKKFKIQSLLRFFISNILILLSALLIEVLLIKSCSGGLCGLSEAEAIILFIPVQILSLLVYGISLILTGFFKKK